MMVPDINKERGRDIDCYLDARPKVTTAQYHDPAIETSEVTSDE
jgi:hypothetical protein